MISNGGKPTNDGEEVFVLVIHSIFWIVSEKIRVLHFPVSQRASQGTWICSDKEDTKIWSLVLCCLLICPLFWFTLMLLLFFLFPYCTLFVVYPLMLMMSSKIRTKIILSFTFNMLNCSTWVHTALLSFVFPPPSRTTKVLLQIT